MTIFLYGLLILTLAILTATVVGTRLPRTHMAASRICLPASPEEIWQTLTDFPAYPTWRPGLASVETGPDFGGLPSWFEICGPIGRMHFRVTERRPPRRLVTQVVNENLPLSGMWIYELEKDGTGTRLTITECENVHHPLLRFFAHFVLRYYGVMDVYLIALALKFGSDARPEHLSLKVDIPELMA